ncbi:serine--tRNA ligase [soil metagenome]
MLDIQFIRDNPELVKEKSAQKNYPVDVGQLLELDSERRTRLTQLDELRARRNAQAADTKGMKPTDDQIDAAKQLKEEITSLETDLTAINAKYEPLLRSVPNMPLDYVPVGASEQENTIVKEVGDIPQFDFEPMHDYQLGAEDKLDLIDKERAAKVSGSRFAYLKGDIVLMQFAIIQLVMHTLGDEAVLQKLIDENGLTISAKPFRPVLPPAVLRTEPYVASARLNAEEVTYQLAQDDLWLNASAEHTLCTMYWNEIIPEESLPIRYIGYATSFRREAGTYGKDVEGIFRMHQFDKLEMEVFSTAETGEQEHKLLIAVQEHLVQLLGLPYRVVQKCTADIGKPNAAGTDIDCWFPGQGAYRETHTADFMADYQSRDLKIRTRKANGETELVHTNDATAFALGRILKAIVENYQTADGHVTVPTALQPLMGGKTHI